MARRSAISGSAAWVAVLAATLIVGAALWLALRRHDDAVAEGQHLKVVNGWFPEPSYLLDHATVLELTPAQKRHVQSTVREWEMKKAAFESRFKTFNLSADTALSDLKANSVPTGDVGSLVQDFDKARARAWSSATLPLNPYQVEKLDKLRDQDEKGKKTAFAPTENRLVVLNNSESTTQSPIEIRPLAEVGRAKSNTSAMKQDLENALAHLNDGKLSAAQREALKGYIRQLSDELERQNSISGGPHAQIPRATPNAKAKLIPLWHGKGKAELLELAKPGAKAAFARIKKSISDH